MARVALLLVLVACACTPTISATGSASPTPAISGTARSTREPYPAPTSCAQSTWLFARRDGYSAYWLEGSNLSAGNEVGLLFEGGNKLQWQPAGPATIALQARSREDAAQSATIEQTPILNSGAVSSNVTFPSPGCWTIHATRGTAVLDAVVFVYPASCRPQYGLGTPSPGIASRPCAP